MNFVKKRSSVQKTVAKPVRFDGVGLHTGAPVSMVVRPAAADSGIVFVRTDRPAPGNRIAALWDNVVISPLATRIQNRRGDSVSTIEHIMAALAGTGITETTHRSPVTAMFRRGSLPRRSTLYPRMFGRC